MKKLLIISCWLLVVGGLFGQINSDGSVMGIMSSVATRGYYVNTIPTFLNNIGLDSIPFNNTNIKINLDSLISGKAVDTTIRKNRTITKYSFTPSVNYWNVTDSCYNARYFFTVDVFQVVTDSPNKVLEKQVADLDAEIVIDQRRIQDKIRARDAAVKLKTKN